MVSAVSIIVIARLLGPSDYGAYTLVLLIPNILITFLGFGVTSGITRYAAYHLARNEPEIARRMTSTGLIFLLVFGAALSAGSFVGAGFLATYVLHRPGLTQLVQFSSLLLLALSFSQSLVALLLGWGYMGLVSLSTVLQAVIRMVAAIALVVLGFGVFGAISGYMFAIFLSSALVLIMYHFRTRAVASVGWADNFASDLKTMLSYGSPLYIGLLASNLSLLYVSVVLAAIASNTYVGFYQSAANVALVVTTVFTVIPQTLFPAFARLKGSESDVGLAFRYATKYTGFVVAPVLFLVMDTAPYIIRTLYGSSFGTASLFLVLLSFSNIPLLFGQTILASFFSGVGQSKLYMFFYLAGALAQVILAPLLAIQGGLGVQGLIYSILIANIVTTTVGLVLSRRYLSASLDFRAAASILLAAEISYIVVLLLQQIRLGDLTALVLDTGVFAIVYLTCAPLLSAIDRDDISRLTVALEGLGRFRTLIQPILSYERLILRLIHR